MKKFLTKLKPFIPAFIMLLIIIVSLIVVLSFDIQISGNIFHKDPHQVYLENKATRNTFLIVSIVLDCIILAFYLLEARFRKTILKWIFFNISFFFMIASSLMIAMSLTQTTCDSLFIMVGVPFLNFFLFIASFVCACLFLKAKKKENI